MKTDASDGAGAVTRLKVGDGYYILVYRDPADVPASAFKEHLKVVVKVSEGDDWPEWLWEGLLDVRFTVMDDGEAEARAAMDDWQHVTMPPLSEDEGILDVWCETVRGGRRVLDYLFGLGWERCEVWELRSRS